METEEFKQALYSMEAAKVKLDNHIWDVFYSYIKREGELFSSPETWEYDEDDESITFRGEDGCMGCYESRILSIPIKFFEEENTS